jgi:hypothetical protein
MAAVIPGGLSGSFLDAGDGYELLQDEQRKW